MKFFISILFLISATVSFATGDPNKNTKVLKGVVSEVNQGESLTGVRVSVVGSDVVTFTDKDGFFELETPINSDLKIVFTLVSFESLQIEVPTMNQDLIQVSLQEK